MQEFIIIPTFLISELPNDKRLALLDILLMADENGEFCSTVRELSDRWKWGTKKTFLFLKNLEQGNILETQRKHKGNTLYIINTEFLNIKGNTKETQRKHKGNTKKEEDTEIYKRIIEHLNMICGTSYRYNTESSRKDIRARLNEGYKEDDFYIVIDKKATEWMGTEQEKYLRPMTLFGTKFESYLNQTIIKEQKRGNIDILDEWRNS